MRLFDQLSPNIIIVGKHFNYVRYADPLTLNRIILLSTSNIMCGNDE